MKKQNYQNIQNWFARHSTAFTWFRRRYSLFPFLLFIAYALLLAVYLFFAIGELVNTPPEEYKVLHDFLKITGIPAIVFFGITIFRKLYNAKRPYEVYPIAPLIKKNKQGQSFPSRHTASAFIIAMAFLYINIPSGCVMLLLSLCIAVMRVLAGVHFIKDVAAAGLISIFAGILFFVI